MPSTPPTTPPIVPPTIAPTGPAARSPSRAPRSAPRSTLWAEADNGAIIAADRNNAAMVLRIILGLLFEHVARQPRHGRLVPVRNIRTREAWLMKKPSKTAAELEASIKVEMEDICDWPTDMIISVEPDGDSWKVVVMQEGSVDDADRREMVEQIAARLRSEYDLKG